MVFSERNFKTHKEKEELGTGKAFFVTLKFIVYKHHFGYTKSVFLSFFGEREFKCLYHNDGDFL